MLDLISCSVARRMICDQALMSCHVQFYQHHFFLSNRECANRYFYLQLYLLFYLPLYIYLSNFVGRCHKSLMGCSDDFRASCAQSSYPSVILSSFLSLSLSVLPHLSEYVGRMISQSLMSCSDDCSARCVHGGAMCSTG